MDDFKPTNDVSDLASGTQAQALGQAPESLARYFFVLTMLGLLGYVTAIVVLMSSAD